VKLREQLAEILGEPETVFNDNLAFKELSSWDSMTHMILVSRLEEGFDVEFTGDEIADFQTVADIRMALSKRGKI
jgi:acyl carrier protein